MLYLFNVLLTLYLCLQGDLMYDNISVVSTNNDLYLLTAFYIMTSALIFSYKMIKVFKIMPYKIYYYWIILTGVIMSIGAFFPYSFNGDDLFSIIHVHCSMAGCVSFLVLLFVYTRLLAIHYYELYNQLHWIYDLFIQLLILCFLFFSRVNGYIEIIYSLIVCFYLYKIETKINQYLNE